MDENIPFATAREKDRIPLNKLFKNEHDLQKENVKSLSDIKMAWENEKEKINSFDIKIKHQIVKDRKKYKKTKHKIVKEKSTIIDSFLNIQRVLTSE